MSTYFPRIGGGDPDIYNAYMMQDNFSPRKRGVSTSLNYFNEKKNREKPVLFFVFSFKILVVFLVVLVGKPRGKQEKIFHFSVQKYDTENTETRINSGIALYMRVSEKVMKK